MLAKTNESNLDVISNQDEVSLGRVVNYFYSLSLWIAIVIAFISLIYAGFSYMMSAQNPGQMKDAQNRIQHIFLGIIILLSSVIMLNFINPELKTIEPSCKDEKCKVEKSKFDISVPESGFEGSAKNLYNKYQTGIPYSNQDAVISSRFYDDVKIPAAGNCRSCDGRLELEIGSSNVAQNKYGICNASCEEDVLFSSDSRNEEQHRIVGLDRLKCHLDVNVSDDTYKSWAIVADSDDNAVLACVGACVKIAGNFNCLSKYDSKDDFGNDYPEVDEDLYQEALAECEEEDNPDECRRGLREEYIIEYESANGEGASAINRFIEGKTGLVVDSWDDIDDSEWYDGKLKNFDNGWIFWGSSGSPDKNALKIHDEDDKSRAKLRACIRGEYLYDAQDLPANIMGNDAKICLCKK